MTSSLRYNPPVTKSSKLYKETVLRFYSFAQQQLFKVETKTLPPQKLHVQQIKIVAKVFCVPFLIFSMYTLEFSPQKTKEEF